MTVQFILILLALTLALINGITGKVPLWISNLLICVALLVR